MQLLRGLSNIDILILVPFGESEKLIAQYRSHESIASCESKLKFNGEKEVSWFPWKSLPSLITYSQVSSSLCFERRDQSQESRHTDRYKHRQSPQGRERVRNIRFLKWQSLRYADTKSKLWMTWRRTYKTNQISWNVRVHQSKVRRCSSSHSTSLFTKTTPYFCQHHHLHRIISRFLVGQYQSFRKLQLYLMSK